MDETSLRPRARRAMLAALVLASALVPATGAASRAEGIEGEACAGTLSLHSRPYLTGLEGLAPASVFYAAPEYQNPASILTVTPAETCSEDPDDFAEPGRVYYGTADASAVAPADYQAIPQTLSDRMCVLAGDPPHDPCPPGTVTTDQVSLDLADDSIPEEAVESFRFVLTRDPNSPPLSGSRPTEAAVHVIDNEGAARVSLEPTLDGSQTKQYTPTEQVSHYHIPVFWAGPGAPGPVPYSIGPASGEPAPTLGEDYLVLSQNPLPAGDFQYGGGRVAFIRLRILNDNAEELNEVLSIRLTGANVVADRDTTTVTIRDGGVDTLAPKTNFHHPKHKKRYRRNAYQLREMHIFYKEPGGAGIQKVQIAIQRKKKNGKCQWWNGKAFRVGRCRGIPAKFWKKTKYERSLDWFRYRVRAFTPTQGTKIRFYRAFARGFDAVGNVETRFKKGRNRNTFWIKRT